MRETDPRDPSLALCQICANANGTLYAQSMDGEVRLYTTCVRYLNVDVNCNDFIPAYTGGRKL